jgi:hypothetical protein
MLHGFREFARYPYWLNVLRGRRSRKITPICQLLYGAIFVGFHTSSNCHFYPDSTVIGIARIWVFTATGALKASVT